MKTELAGEVIRASQGQQHQDSRDQKEWNLFIICIESNWFQFISLFHQPLQPQNFIHYPFTNHFFGSLWGTLFANWFGAWNQQFLNKRFKKKKIIMFWDFGERFESKWKGINPQEKHLNLFNFRIITKESKEWSLANQFHFFTKSKPQWKLYLLPFARGVVNKV